MLLKPQLDQGFHQKVLLIKLSLALVINLSLIKTAVKGIPFAIDLPNTAISGSILYFLCKPP